MSTWYQRALARGILILGGARVEGKTHDGEKTEPVFPPQAIYFANHSSHLDFLTLWAIMPAELRPSVRPIAAADYWGSGAKGAAAKKLFNAHLVHRGKSSPQPSGEHTGSQLEGMTAILDAGDSLIIFPEGTRGDAATVEKFHSGLYKLAAHAPDIPVVPVTLKNLGKILPKGETVPVPYLSTVVVHEPIFLNQSSKIDDAEAGELESQEDFLARARNIIAQELTSELSTTVIEGEPRGSD